MLCVLDASVTLAWFFEDEDSPYAEQVMESVARQRAVVPLVWPLEIQNAILIAVRRGRLAEPQAAPFLAVLDRMPIEIDGQIARGRTGERLFGLAMTNRLSAYDASYLELAIRRGLPLATQDQRLAQAATAAGVVILAP